MTTNLVAKNNSHLLSHSSVGQNSEQVPSLVGFSAQCLTEPNARYQPVWAPLWRFGGKICFQDHLGFWKSSSLQTAEIPVSFVGC